jgi:deoxyribose-phosphate aldolase
MQADKLTLAEVARKIEHTLLKPSASEKEIIQLCQEAQEYHFFGVCVAGSFLSLARRELVQSATQIVSVVGFPHGNGHSKVKRDEIRTLIDEGAHELDVVLNWGALKEGREQYLLDELESLVQAAGSVPLKLIIEAAELNPSEKRKACELAQKVNFAFVKTSTGFASGGASAADVKIMRETVGPLMGIKASGGIKTWAQANDLIAAGANRIGASSSVQILKECRESLEKV